MKVSVSLPGETSSSLTIRQEAGVESRSAVVHKAVRLLRGSELSAASRSLARMDGSEMPKRGVRSADGLSP